MGWNPDKDNPVDINCHGLCGILDDPRALGVTERPRSDSTNSTGMVVCGSGHDGNTDVKRGPKSKKIDDIDTGKKIILMLKRIEKNERAYKEEHFDLLCTAEVKRRPKPRNNDMDTGKKIILML